MNDKRQEIRDLRTILMAEGHDAFVAQMAAGLIVRGVDREQALKAALNSLDS